MNYWNIQITLSGKSGIYFSFKSVTLEKKEILLKVVIKRETLKQ